MEQGIETQMMWVAPTHPAAGGRWWGYEGAGSGGHLLALQLQHKAELISCNGWRKRWVL